VSKALPEVLIVAPLFAPALARLEREFRCYRYYDAPAPRALLDEVASRIRGVASFLAMPRELFDALPRLEIIANFGVGVDGIDLAEAKRRGIIVTNSPDVLNDCVADTALGLTLNVLRRFPRAEEHLRAGRWATQGAFPLASSLGGKTMGILGLGRIGEAIARRAIAFGMQVRYHNRQRKDVPYAYEPDAVALARASDVLLVATPGGEDTRHLVGARVLDALGPEGYLVNIARGSVVDEPVLLRYLQEKRIAGAGLDVFADEPNVPPAFFSLENAVLLPHVASATVETRTAMGNLQFENLRRHFSGEQVLTRVV
jgi:lactate dehydrogenase-like 2-hydroxyacid dehydrogenase